MAISQGSRVLVLSSEWVGLRLAEITILSGTSGAGNPICNLMVSIDCEDAALCNEHNGPMPLRNVEILPLGTAQTSPLRVGGLAVYKAIERTDTDAGQNAALAALQAQLDALSASLSGTQATVASQGSTISSQASSIAGLSTSVTTLNATTATHTTQIAALQAIPAGTVVVSVAFSVTIGISIGTATKNVTHASLVSTSKCWAVLIGVQGLVDTPSVTCNVPGTGSVDVNFKKTLNLASQTYSGVLYFYN